MNGKDPSGKSCLNKLKFKQNLKKKKKFKAIRHLVFEIKRTIDFQKGLEM